MEDILDRKTLEMLADMCMDGVIVINISGVVVYVNDVYCKIIHRERKDILNRNINDFAAASKLPEVISSRMEMLGQFQEFFKSDEPVDSIEKVLFINRKPIIQNDKVIGAIGYVKAYSTTHEISAKIKQLNDEVLLYKNELVKNGFTLDFDSITSKSAAMQRIKKMAMRVANSDFPVLLLGETGTGKEVFANAIHAASMRKSKPLIKVNCAAIPENLFESELFGYEEGAFSGAKKGGKPGKFELANEGTIFLDEIGDMPLNIQSKLLRALQEGEFERVGGTKTIRANFRLLAATNQDLLERVTAKKFREDLYYRISTVPIKIPPLRERKEDLPTLIDLFICELNHRYGTQKTLDNHALHCIMQQSFPGNVRELKNVIGRAYIMCESNIISSDDLAFQDSDVIQNDHVETLDQRQQAERDKIISTLQKVDYNCAKAAGIIGITRMTLYRRINKYNIDLKRS